MPRKTRQPEGITGIFAENVSAGVEAALKRKGYVPIKDVERAYPEANRGRRLDLELARPDKFYDVGVDINSYDSGPRVEITFGARFNRDPRTYVHRPWENVTAGLPMGKYSFRRCRIDPSHNAVTFILGSYLGTATNPMSQKASISEIVRTIGQVYDHLGGDKNHRRLKSRG